VRILTVSHFFDGHGGGIERVAGRLSKEFADLGATSAWAASNGNALPIGRVRAIGLACFNPTEKLAGLPMPVPRLSGIRTLSSAVSHSDVVVIHDALYATSILAMLFAKAQGKRVILFQHIAGIPFSSRVLRLVLGAANLLVTRPMLQAADVRVFISDTVQQELVGKSNRFYSELLFNGVDQRIFHPPTDPANGSEPLPSHPTRGNRRVLFVGRYVEKKGLAVVRALAESRADLTFTLVGSGPIRPGDWGLANVDDLGAQTPEKIADLYRAADLLLLPSVGEGYPLVIQEAMACGLPVVCGSPCDRSDPTAARWLRGVKIVLAQPQESAKRCSEAIDSFFLSAADRRAMADYALQRYDWRLMAQRLMALANPMVARK
jgi:glycosyltransferase involved in cell wall biosynthesis